jgi:putative acyl-CoA dehydrogenase
MTYAAIPALRQEPSLAAQYEPLLTSESYDFGLRAPRQGGLLAGMSMTEKQGGSDVRANTTTAVPQPDGTYRWSATSGSPRRPCATCSSPWPRPRPG